MQASLRDREGACVVDPLPDMAGVAAVESHTFSDSPALPPPPAQHQRVDHVAAEPAGAAHTVAGAGVGAGGRGEAEDREEHAGLHHGVGALVGLRMARWESPTKSQHNLAATELRSGSAALEKAPQTAETGGIAHLTLPAKKALAPDISPPLHQGVASLVSL